MTAANANDGSSGDAGRSRARHSFFREHLFAARHFAERARAMEDRGVDEIDEDGFEEHRAYVIGAVLSAAAFLEASINDLYLEMQEAGAPELLQVPRRTLALLPRVLPELERSPILHRYQIALLCSDSERFNESRSPFRDADSLLRLRDALVNRRSEWDDRRRKQSRLEYRLQNKFAPNALARAADSSFPETCLGAACAEWAVRTAEQFSNDFCQRMAIPSRGLEWREGAA